MGDIAEIRNALKNAPMPNKEAIEQAEKRNAQLTKPFGSLGRLEEIAKFIAGWHGTAKPKIIKPQIVIFAGNHGIAKRGVSAFPLEVTAQMVANFEAGGAAINQLARVSNALFSCIPIRLEKPTHDFTDDAAMSEEQFYRAFEIGRQSVHPDCDLFIAGDMGIGNTTSASALFAANFGGGGGDWVGSGTGIDDKTLALKAQIVDDGLKKHHGVTGLDALQRLGGYEIAAIAGSILGAREKKIPVILDGFIATSAAACLFIEEKTALSHCLLGHVSAEKAHFQAAELMGLDPLLTLGLRLGEGSGAALAIPLVVAALECHSEMASFEDAGVSSKL